MPRALTEHQASNKICPFMNNNREIDGWTFCQARSCACWGWVDPEEGQMGERIGEMINVYKGEDPPPNPDGGHWVKVSLSTYTDGWACHKIIGPRRGQCEAMSPHITVEAS